MRRFYLICFDITNDKIRRKVVKALLAKGIRVQKSVFEAILTDNQYIKLKDKLDSLIDYSTDSIRYYLLCKNCSENIDISGIGSFTYDEDVIVV